MSQLKFAERENALNPTIHLSGDPKFLWEISLNVQQSWQKGALSKADFVFAYISEPICAHTLAEIWTAIEDGIPVYLFFEPGIDRELFWHCRRAAAQWLGFTTVHRNRLWPLFGQVIADWGGRQ